MEYIHFSSIQPIYIDQKRIRIRFLQLERFLLCLAPAPTKSRLKEFRSRAEDVLVYYHPLFILAYQEDYVLRIVGSAASCEIKQSLSTPGTHFLLFEGVSCSFALLFDMTGCARYRSAAVRVDRIYKG
jgi:hypothetical protein